MVGTKPLPDDLNAILSHMQGKQIVQRKIARKSSKNTIRSLWSRKSTKKSPESGPIVTAKSTCMDDSQQIVDPEDSLNGQPELSDTLHSILSRSIIPDPLGELPAWFKKESDMAAANMSTYRIKYPLHNPLGPRWYKNHHLIPPAQLNPGNRPPSFFSPSFPPMASAISHDPSEETTRVPDPSKTPSGSPLPTPSSSQVRIPDIERISRSRKTSQDNVDMLDVSDPWGTHWHHQSPYDAGSNTSPISVDTSEGITKCRSRLSSMTTTQSRRKTVTPSPLSQSTSALHLQASDTVHVSRKLSKRRKPVLGGLFGGYTQRLDVNTPLHAPAPITQVDPPLRTSQQSMLPDGLQSGSAVSKRHSALPYSTLLLPNASTSALSRSSSMNKQERRESVLGRLARKFSVLKKSSQDASRMPQSDNRDSTIFQWQASSEKLITEKKPMDSVRRVPPPRVASDMVHLEAGVHELETSHVFYDPRSSISFEAPYSIGKLTIANPDAPSSVGTTSVKSLASLPPEHQVNCVLGSTEPPSDHVLGSEQPISEPAVAGTDRLSFKSKIQSSTFVKAGLGPAIDQQPITTTLHPGPVTQQAPVLSLKPATPSKQSEGGKVFLAQQLSSGMVAAFSPLADDSPLSKASVLANPPTPYHSPGAGADLPSTTVDKPPANWPDERLPARDTSPTMHAGSERDPRIAKSSSLASRKTETFKLVRTPSDHISALGDTIINNGEQWAVVNSVQAPRRSKTNKVEKGERISKKASDRESGRKERKRLGTFAADSPADYQRRTFSQAQKTPVNGDHVEYSSAEFPSIRPSRARSLDVPPRPGIAQPVMSSYHGDTTNRNKGNDTQREGSRQRSAHSGSRYQLTFPIPNVVSHVEHFPSTSARPTSELSAADINALRAREIWEMDRLWKGRTMYHGAPEVSVINTPPSTRDSRHFLPYSESARDNISTRSVGHGSSHTSYVVQTPFQAHPIPATVFYANMPSVPPPMIIVPPCGQPARPSSSLHDYSATYKSLPDSFTFPSKESLIEHMSSRPSNPLPSPPQESTYQPAALPSLTDPNSSGSAVEYWTAKYTSVTTAH